MDYKVKSASLIAALVMVFWEGALHVNESNAQSNEKHPYSLPYEKGERFRVGQVFNDTPTHQGEFAYSIDFIMPEGTPICAARGGIVIKVIDKYSGGGFKQQYLSKNNFVHILHDDGTIAEYNHIKNNGAKVKEGDRVKTADFIAYSGNVGYSDGPHLHFSVLKPINGKNMSIPFGFITDYFDYEILQKREVYSFTGKSLKGERPFIYIEDVILCKKIINQWPVDITTSFFTKDKLRIFVSLNAKRDHKINMLLYKNNYPTPIKNYDWMIKKGTWRTWTEPFDFDFSTIPDPSGLWKAEIIIDKKTIGIKEFTVKSGS